MSDTEEPNGVDTKLKEDDNISTLTLQDSLTHLKPLLATLTEIGYLDEHDLDFSELESLEDLDLCILQSKTGVESARAPTRKQVMLHILKLLKMIIENASDIEAFITSCRDMLEALHHQLDENLDTIDQQQSATKMAWHQLNFMLDQQSGVLPNDFVILNIQPDVIESILDTPFDESTEVFFDYLWQTERTRQKKRKIDNFIIPGVSLTKQNRLETAFNISAKYRTLWIGDTCYYGQDNPSPDKLLDKAKKALSKDGCRNRMLFEDDSNETRHVALFTGYIFGPEQYDVSGNSWHVTIPPSLAYTRQMIEDDARRLNVETRTHRIAGYGRNLPALKIGSSSSEWENPQHTDEDFLTKKLGLDYPYVNAYVPFDDNPKCTGQFMPAFYPSGDTDKKIQISIDQYRLTEAVYREVVRICSMADEDPGNGERPQGRPERIAEKEVKQLIKLILDTENDDAFSNGIKGMELEGTEMDGNVVKMTISIQYNGTPSAYKITIKGTGSNQ